MTKGIESERREFRFPLRCKKHNEKLRMQFETRLRHVIASRAVYSLFVACIAFLRESYRRIASAINFFEILICIYIYIYILFINSVFLDYNLHEIILIGFNKQESRSCSRSYESTKAMKLSVQDFPESLSGKALRKTLVRAACKSSCRNFNSYKQRDRGRRNRRVKFVNLNQDQAICWSCERAS